MVRRSLLLVALLGVAACGDAEEKCVESDCIVPPASICAEGMLVTYEAAGICLKDECEYESLTEPCLAGCNAEGTACLAGGS